MPLWFIIFRLHAFALSCRWDTSAFKGEFRWGGGGVGVSSHPPFEVAKITEIFEKNCKTLGTVTSMLSQLSGQHCICGVTVLNKFQFLN